MNTDNLIGLDLKDAEKEVTDAGFVSRIVSQDGEFFVLTADYRTDRVNLGVQNNKIISARIG